MAADPITSNTVGELLNYDVSDDNDPFGDIAPSRARDDKANLSPRGPKRKLDEDKENFGLGLDEEVKITKKRRPVAKLDEARLLSQPGIPKLRALARSGQITKKLHLKGKGHEFSDAARLLNYYQLWLDDLYPRAKFADGLQLVEKVGHSKRMQVMRREWIDEGKPDYLRRREKRTTGLGDEDPDDEMSDGAAKDVAGRTKELEAANDKQKMGEARESLFGHGREDDNLFFPDANERDCQYDRREAPEDDELDVLLAEQMPSRPAAVPKRVEPDSEGEDDLDALLAEQDSRRNIYSRSTPETRKGNIEHSEDEEDALDALLAEQESRPNTSIATSRPSNTTMNDIDRPRSISPDKKRNGNETPAIFSSSPIPNNEFDDDDLDALLAKEEAQPPASTTPKPMAEANLGETVLRGNKPQSKTDETEMTFSSSPFPNDDKFDDDDLNKLLTEQTSSKKNHLYMNLEDKAIKEEVIRAAYNAVPLAQADDDNDGPLFSSSPIPNDELDQDDLDALLASQEG